MLFIDNCTAHNSIPTIENVEVLFLPPNMTCCSANEPRNYKKFQTPQM